MIVNPSFGGEGTGKLPSGGTVGQVLTKKSAADNDAEWKDAPGVPSGVICMWSGAANAIPAGWLLCNGSNGTPDLRNRFIVGAGSSYGVGATGGSETVTLTVDQMPFHNHGYYIFGSDSGGTVGAIRASGAESIPNKNYTTFAGSNSPHENRPPYYALCFIMKQ